MPVESVENFRITLHQLPERDRWAVVVMVEQTPPYALLWAEYVDDSPMIDALAIADAALYAYGTTGLLGLEAFWESQYPTHPSGVRSTTPR